MKANDETNGRESVLLSSAAKGDLEAFNDLVLKYQDLVYNITCGILGNADAAQDATQEAFLRAFQHIDGFRGGSFRCWLLRIAANTCYDVLRTLRRHPTVPLLPEDDDGNEVDSPLWLADPRSSPEAETEKDEFLQTLYHRIDEMPAVYRTVITLVDLNGLDYDEAAQALGVPIGTVKSRLARARLQIKEELFRDSHCASDLRLSNARAAI
jgi:RNA polymerase sigma-70 factor, ECF subfamily